MLVDHGVHAAEGVVPVGVGEVAVEGLAQQSPGVVSSLRIEVGGVDQAGGENLGVHTVVCSPNPRP